MVGIPTIMWSGTMRLEKSAQQLKECCQPGFYLRETDSDFTTVFLQKKSNKLAVLLDSLIGLKFSKFIQPDIRRKLGLLLHMRFQPPGAGNEITSASDE
jgi:hypothetical protein